MLELLEVPGMQAQEGELVILGEWSDTDLLKLTVHEPGPTGHVISLREVYH